jgi:hypothetical protein
LGKVDFVQGKEAASDTLISMLDKELPECKGLSKTTLLKIISSSLGRKLTYVGKSRYVAQNVTLVRNF